MDKKKIQPPVAEKIPKKLITHDDVRIDDYFWLNQIDNPRVLGYINAENAYFDQMTASTKTLEERLFEEMKSRIKEDDQSVPYKYNGYWYIVKYETGKNYPIYTRKKETLEASEELLFDCNEMAKDSEYFKLAGLSISPDNTMVSFGVDTLGRRQYTIQIKNLLTGEILQDSIENTTGSASWANDNKTLFYTKNDVVTLRSDKIYKHIVGSEEEDILIYEETDETFGVTVYKSKSRKYLILACYSTLTNEYHVLNADHPNDDFKVFQERVTGLEYSIAHFENYFYIVTNKDDATNFKLMRAPESNTKIDYWEEVVPHRSDVLLEDIDIFRDYLVISERCNGLNQIRIQRWDKTDDFYLPFDNETYMAYTGTNVDFDTPILRYAYNSLTTPSSVIDFDMSAKTQTILKEQEVLGGRFKKENYTSKRIWATANDGTKIPISMVYKKDIEISSKTPLLLYGYGAYGHSLDPHFSSVRLSLLDRGFIYAIAHVRGGEDLGREWYEEGKLLKKNNSFTDFIACSKYLIKENYTSQDHLYALGGSAGGLLVAAVTNMEPELYKGVVMSVPFVDVLTTMLDESIPLTTGEYDEWGNPNEKRYYNYIKSYSPYDNIISQGYPHILVTTGLHDSQVQYWEPLKWVAKLRGTKTDANKLLLKTNMKAGHSGASGRFESLKEDAIEYAFLLDLENIHN